MAVHTTPEGTLALILTVLVDIVSPGKGIMIADNFGGIALRQARGGYRVETELGDFVGMAKSYHEAAIRLARHHGHNRAAISVEIEDETRSR